MHCDVAARKALSMPGERNTAVTADTVTIADSDTLPDKPDLAQSVAPVKSDLAQSNIPVKPDLDLDLGLGVIGGFSIALPPFLSPAQRDARTSAFAVGAAGGLLGGAAHTPVDIVPSSTTTAITSTTITTDTTTSTTASTATTIDATTPSPSVVPSASSPCPLSMAPAMARLALHYARSIRLLQLLSSCTTPRDVLFHLLAAVKWLVRDATDVLVYLSIDVPTYLCTEQPTFAADLYITTTKHPLIYLCTYLPIHPPTFLPTYLPTAA